MFVLKGSVILMSTYQTIWLKEIEFERFLQALFRWEIFMKWSKNIHGWKKFFESDLGSQRWGMGFEWIRCKMEARLLRDRENSIKCFTMKGYLRKIK